MLTMEAAIYTPRAMMSNKIKKPHAPTASSRRANNPRVRPKTTNPKRSNKMTSRMMTSRI